MNTTNCTAESADRSRYRRYKIERADPPIPGEWWTFVHDDYDGPGDERCGFARSRADVLKMIDEIENEHPSGAMPRAALTIEDAMEDLREAVILLRSEERSDEDQLRLEELLDAVHEQVREVEDALLEDEAI